MTEWGRAMERLGKAQLRASCRFCRNRKLKCSGGSPCEVCKKRGTPCEYDATARMGRPPGKKKSRARAEQSDSNPTTVGSVFDQLFANLFGGIASSNSIDSGFGSPSVAFSIALQAYLSRCELFPPEVTTEEASEQQPCGPSLYPFLLPLVARDMVESCCWHIRWPHTHEDQRRRPSYYAISLANDRTPCMPWPEPNHHPTLRELIPDGQERARLLESWWNTHPAASILPSHMRSTLLSKPDEPPSSLTALILAEALLLESPSGNPSADRLLSEAHRAFQHDVLREDNRLDLAAAAALFAWHHLCHVQARIGTAFLALSCQLLASRQEDSQINLSTANLQSLQRSMTVWAFSQLDTSLGSVLSNVAGSATQSLCSPQMRCLTIVSDVVSEVLAEIPGGTRDKSRMQDNPRAFARDGYTALERSITSTLNLHFHLTRPLTDDLVDNVLAECRAIEPLVEVVEAQRRAGPSARENILSKVAHTATIADATSPSVPAHSASTPSSGGPDLAMICVAVSLHLEAASKVLKHLSEITAAHDSRVQEMAEHLLRIAEKPWLADTAVHLQTKQCLVRVCDRLDGNTIDSNAIGTPSLDAPTSSTASPLGTNDTNLLTLDDLFSAIHVPNDGLLNATENKQGEATVMDTANLDWLLGPTSHDATATVPDVMALLWGQDVFE